MVPADQRFVTDDPDRLGTDDGLVAKMEGAFRYSDAQIVLEQLARPRTRQHLVREEPVDAAAIALCGVQREIGVADQRLGVFAVVGRDRDANRTADRDRGAADEIGLRQRGDQIPRQIGQRVAIVDTG